MSIEIHKPQETVEKSSWEVLREESRKFWNQARQDGRRTRFGHSDELAEHVVFKITSFVVDFSNKSEKEARALEMKKLISQGKYGEVIDRGQQYYAKEYLPQNTDAKPVLVEAIFSSLA